PVPDLLEQLVPGEHPITMLDEVHEEVEDLGLNGDGISRPADPVQGGVNDVIGHLIFHATPSAGGTRLDEGRRRPTPRRREGRFRVASSIVIESPWKDYPGIKHRSLVSG